MIKKTTPKPRITNFIKLGNSFKKKYSDLNSITFVHHDNTERVLNLNPEFFRNKNKLLRPVEVIERIKTLEHDFMAKFFKL